ncbi:ATP-binding cassette domain-containing protein [Pediococcus parvulus]|uniref:ATP-binding cassette domain-containing protein n=3 Tax=Pediococcus parvulus TaxID=54062 RepID=UPI00070B2390|nr:ABC transporter ATP-binding protein [Pediococcus parvulus]MCT3027802.1 ATP-binding cassette domain-containing protein [Pediococcus parvulus]GEL90490.1 ABC transporter ATP-binding protein [Pediococcus parvulus]GHC14818.1 ABC transporter ATP-binding protein [Pediococcus parvulus]
MTDILTIKNLSYKRNLTNILNQLNCSLPTGSIVGLLGENGAGKTTLMRLISGAANHYRGEIKVSSETSPSDRKQLVSFSHQVDDVNRSDRLEKIAHFYEAVYPDFSTNKFQRLSEFLNLDLSRHLNDLSKGNQMKFIIAITLSRQVKLYLLDEPFDGIDSMSRKKIIASILQWKPEDATILISDHHVDDIANILDGILIVKDKRIIVSKNADKIREDYGQSIEDFFESFYKGEDQND